MSRKEELVHEYDHLEKELVDVDNNVYSMRWSVPTRESIEEYNRLRNRSKQIEDRMSEIIIEIAQLLKDGK